MRGTYNILFLSRRDSARSLIAEAVVNRHGHGRFHAFSAGVEPAEVSEPLALEVLASAGLETSGLRPKHWREFCRDDSPNMDFVFALSDTAAGETLPEWRGHPLTAHWRYPDPVKADGSDWQKKRAFTQILNGLERQFMIFMQLPFESLDRIALKQRIDEIGAPERRESAA
jgi:arsenate reductase (thioredoxin)